MQKKTHNIYVGWSIGSLPRFGKNFLGICFRSIDRYGLEDFFGQKKLGPFLLKIPSFSSFSRNMFCYIIIYRENIRKKTNRVPKQLFSQFFTVKNVNILGAENDEKRGPPYRIYWILGHFLEL